MTSNNVQPFTAAMLQLPSICS